MRLIKLCFVPILLLILPSIGKSQVIDYQRQAQIFNTIDESDQDIQYGEGITKYLINDALIEKIPLTLDVYNPDTSSATPSNGKRAVLIMIPGGGRTGCVGVSSCDQKTIKDGTRNINGDVVQNLSQEGTNYNEHGATISTARNFAKFGFVVLVLNTRYDYHDLRFDKTNSHRWKKSDSSIWPGDNNNLLNNGSAHLENLVVDIKRAVRWISNPAQSGSNAYNIDPDNIFVYGASGGAKMASMATITPTDTLTVDDPLHRVFDSDPLSQYQIEVSKNNLNIDQIAIRGAIIVNGDTQGTKHLELITPDTGGFMFYHGTKDKSIYHGMAETIEEKCDSQGCVTQFYSIPNAGHGGTPTPAASQSYLHTDYNSNKPIRFHVYSFIVNNLDHGIPDTRPELFIDPSSSNVVFNEDDPSGSADIIIKLSSEAPAGGVTFTVAADQTREVIEEISRKGNYEDIDKFVANDSLTSGPVIYDQGTGVAFEDKDNVTNKLLQYIDANGIGTYPPSPSGGPGADNNVVLPAGLDYFYGDFVGKRQIITINPPDDSAVFSVDLINNGISEDDECFKVRLLNANGAKITNAVEVITIKDAQNSTAAESSLDVCGNPGSPPVNTDPIVSIVSSESVDEGDSIALGVSLSSTSSKSIIVEFATADVSAREEFDYTARDGTIVFDPGDTYKTRTVQTLQDTEGEGDETFTMLLSNPMNATLGNTTATVTINDDDVGSAPVISIDSTTVEEGDGATLRFTLSQAHPSNVVVNYGTVDGNAINGSDYLSKNGIIVFKPGEALFHERTFSTVEDASNEGTESFSVQLTNPVNASLGMATGTITITDDDTNPNIPVITVNDKNAFENTSLSGNNAYIRLSTPNALQNDIVFNYVTKVGIGTSGASSDDFVWTSSTVTMQAGNTTKYVPVTIIDDALCSPGGEAEYETFTVEFSVVSGSSAVFDSGDNTALFTIEDNDKSTTDNCFSQVGSIDYTNNGTTGTGSMTFDIIATDGDGIIGGTDAVKLNPNTNEIIPDSFICNAGIGSVNGYPTKYTCTVTLGSTGNQAQKFAVLIEDTTGAKSYKGVNFTISN